MHTQCPGNATFTRIYSKLIISVDANKQLAFSVLLNGERDIDGDFQLAEYYEKGIGTDINKDEAKKLYSQIANEPHYPELARKAKEKLRSLG
jgi:TPR repeat protein